ncbi:uncharacterized membrane protein At1g75140-like [Arachis hypogaea]|uniref:uncharacterized membrane protein At1g75140-like n=1 Tax=Arachis hypogaea TaxID=3818 RepID=UPI000DECAE5E|nr:uncharacterized membrane protein At1g75140-like [Arachis hypogaea]XP_025660538.1 uncharacterized membrane protein At1g75140-like [Arachis hypogaea]
MACSQKGKFFMFFLLLFFCYVHVFSNPIDPESLSSCSLQPHHDSSSCSEAVSEQPQQPNHVNQEVLFSKLEELVRNLSEIVSKLESKLPEVVDSDRSGIQEKGKSNYRNSVDFVDRRTSREGVEDGEEFEGKFRDGKKTKGMSVTKYTPFWSERFQFSSAVKLDSDATCINVLPFRDHEGLSKYVAVGDKNGKLYVFLRTGDVLVELGSWLDSPVTAMVSYTSAYKNESFLVTGHENGGISMHRVWEGSGGEDWSSLFMENVGTRFVSPGSEGEGSPVSILEVHYVGRMKYILSTDANGKIKVFKEDGTFHGSVVPSSRPLVFLKQRLMFLTETGAGSLDLRGMKIKESECEGLNQSVARNYVFDATERSKAYGFTSEGDLIYILLLGDVMNFKCRVRYKKKMDMEEPVALQAIKGYLLVVNPEKAFVFNVSSPHYVRIGLPRLVFSSSLDELRSSFLNYPSASLDSETNGIPLIASDREKLVVVGLGGGYIGIYHSNLPIFKGEFNTMLWTSPVLFFLLFLFAAWHFFAKKKEALTSWGPDDPFSSTSAPTGAPLASGSGDRSFVDSSSRSAEVMDLRGGPLRGPSRRYGSPSRYPGGATSSYRLGSADHNPRPASVDPDFRGASELKYRATTMEPPGFPKRRDPLFAGNQGANDRS